MERKSLNELALFAGAGGGILGGKLLGWRTVCAVEWEPYPASVLVARQNDGILAPFPIWDDVRTFDGRPGEDLLMWFREGFPAKTSVQPEKALASTESEAGCGWRWPESSVKFDLNTSSWKTRQCSLLEGLDEFSETWPRWGMMRDGECWELPTSGLNTTESGYGYSLPTPSGVKGKGHCVGALGEWGGSTNVFRTMGLGNVHCPRFEEWIMDWPETWAALTPLETARFQAWLLSHGESSAETPNP